MVGFRVTEFTMVAGVGFRFPSISICSFHRCLYHFCMFTQTHRSGDFDIATNLYTKTHPLHLFLRIQIIICNRTLTICMVLPGT